MQNDTFNAKVIKLNTNVILSIIDIEEITPALEDFINKEFVSICEGNSGSNLDMVKSEILIFLNRQDKNTKMGASAEFFIHLYLKYNNFKQECLFRNLEEGSIKKGFDGYYSRNNEQWIMESKSGSIKTNDISHKKKVKEAYTGLKSLIEGHSTNNPWKNAYNHARHGDVNTKESIIKSIKIISDLYTLKKYMDIKDLNILPCSTIYLDNIWENTNKEKIKEDVLDLVKDFNFNQLKIICVTKKTLDLFKNFLNNKGL